MNLKSIFTCEADSGKVRLKLRAHVALAPFFTIMLSEYFAVRNAPIRNKENGNPKQGTHQFETRNAPIRARNALADKAISCS